MRLTAHAREVIRNATREVFGADAHHSATASSTNTSPTATPSLRICGLPEAYSRMLVETLRRLRDDAVTRLGLPADQLPGDIR
jgi:hypothetical protein